MSSSLFTERLHQCLDETGAPSSIRERAVILAKMMDIPKQLAFAMLEGHQTPDKEMLQKLASEFEVESDWLSGK